MVSGQIAFEIVRFVKLRTGTVALALVSSVEGTPLRVTVFVIEEPALNGANSFALVSYKISALEFGGRFIPDITRPSGVTSVSRGVERTPLI